jgi:hypothetical protein
MAVASTARGRARTRDDPSVTRRRPSFPPDVAHALQRPAGSVSLRYTVPAALAGGPRINTALMETPYETVLASLTLDTKLNLRFIRTGNRAEGARVALVNVAPLLGAGRHWNIELAWDSDQMRVAVCEQHAHGGPLLEGHWPRPDQVWRSTRPGDCA